jgi:hypothetical protein
MNEAGKLVALAGASALIQPGRRSSAARETTWPEELPIGSALSEPVVGLDGPRQAGHGSATSASVLLGKVA